MKSAKDPTHEPPSSGPAAIELEDLVPIALVIGAGCEGCAKKLVTRASQRGTPEALVARTLGIVARMGSLECLARAVGPEVVGRMKRSLRAGEEALQQAQGRPRDRKCCGQAAATPGTGPEPRG